MHIGIMYSATNHILSRVTEQEDGILNSVAAGTMTGVIYKSTGGVIFVFDYYYSSLLLAGMRAIVMAGSVGACFVTLISVGQYLYNNRYKFLRYNTA